jgi:methionyl-tRNA synthetase
MEAVLYVTAEVLRRIGILVQPYVPSAAAKLLDLLAVPGGERRFADLDRPLVTGTALPAPAPVFPRYVAAEEKVT